MAVLFLVPRHYECQVRCADPFSLLEEGRDLSAGFNGLQRFDYTVRRLRPLARRRASTRRPPLVDMRARKPWVFARLRLLGWYVRFMVMPFLRF